MIKTFVIGKDDPLTEEDKKMLEDLGSKPIVYDEDDPKLTEKELEEFKMIAKKRKEERKKETISIRLQSQDVKMIKSLGKGYTSILSRAITDLIHHKEKLEPYL